MSGAAVTGLLVTPVKGTRIGPADEIVIEPGGARGDRRFCVIDTAGRMVNGKVHAGLQTIVASLEGDGLTLAFPDGHRAAGQVERGPELVIRFFGRPTAARLIDGPWAAAISQHLGAELRLAEVIGGEDRASGVDRGDAGAVSLISRGSLDRLAAEAGADAVDPRRFRMLIEIDGVEANAEDAWIGGAPVRIGEALVRFEGHVGRCLITSRDPETAEVTLPTLKLLAGYRRELESTEPLPLGIHGRVLEPGRVRIGDPVGVSAQ